MERTYFVNGQMTITIGPFVPLPLRRIIVYTHVLCERIEGRKCAFFRRIPANKSGVFAVYLDRENHRVDKRSIQKDTKLERDEVRLYNPVVIEN